MIYEVCLANRCMRVEMELIDYFRIPNIMCIIHVPSQVIMYSTHVWSPERVLLSTL